jgi:hypothetical protein
MMFFVMPSKHESFGRVYCWALDQGLPIVYKQKKWGFDGFLTMFCRLLCSSYDFCNIADRRENIIDNHSQISNYSVLVCK